ncbi:Actin cytoskeleton-regulatory complex protein [Mycena indigotica]|uniref:Actin cytoskeleton-regulatory complex protein PAN1 n=1 Tax=Mycena indigotica TaxID=2126181 RepID=A0A8H6VY62_9AGAR|nr:Actin cytoskeleton-regulatory complex protein [Mycena indigotica]KAF7294543.1 Actin cytoskeleton-regulatory complex protein [Mycena indigotica]
MSQWQQPGYQYPMQTGYPGVNANFQQQPQQPGQFQQAPGQFQQPQQFQQAPGLVPQPTGYVPPRPMAMQQTGFVQSQPTGYGGFQHRPAPPPPPVPSLPTQFQGQGSNFLNPQLPNRSFLNTSPSPGGGGLMPQATGFPGQRLVAQPTGFVDPRLQMMSNSFMPMNISSPYGAGGAPQLQPQQPVSLQQSFQQMQTQKPRVSWALGKAEKKQYDQIFRAWDAQRTGFIDGKTALEVFGQSGLSKDDLARIWGLADVDDRGKLNIAEFHVAMGIIYRRLNGSEIPDQLPPELIPPSVTAIEDSVNMLTDLLKNEPRSRTPNSEVSYQPQRSFTNTTSTPAGRDATIYRHDDSQSAYKPRSRHLNRDDVRATAELNSSSADLNDMKRALANTASMLDRAAEQDKQRTAEDEELEREMDDLKYRVDRIREDLDYVSRGPRSAAKDEEKRKLERELMELTHVRVPEVERKLKAREERRDREKREYARDRDRRNDRFGRFGDRDDDRDRYDRDRDHRRYEDDRDRDRDRPYSRGGYREDRDYDRGSYRRRSPSRDRDRDRDQDRQRDRDRDYERPRSAAPPEPAPVARPAPSPSPAPPAASPAPATKNMTPEERQAFARAEARRRVEERMKALGVTPTPSPAVVDSSVEERLAQEKKEAEEKARIASKEAEEREAARQSRLANEKAVKDGGATAPTPTKTVSAAPPAPTPTSKAVPPPPKPKSAPPPPIRQKAAPPPPKPRITPVAPAPPKVVVPEVDPEEELFRQKEAALLKQREERAERLRKMMEEEEEQARRDEEEMQKRIQARKNAQAAKERDRDSSVASVSTRSPSPVMVVAPTPPPAPVSVTTPPEKASGTNPFSRFMKEGGSAASTPATAPSTNPWAQASSSTPVATPSVASAAPVRTNPFPTAASNTKSSYHTAPKDSLDDDWEDIQEKDDDDSDSDDPLTSRDARKDFAKQLFQNILPSAPSPGPAGGSRSGTPATPASASAGPPPPPPPPAPPMAPPAPPMAPPAPPPPAMGVTSAPAARPDTSALLLAIQGGKSLRKTVTVDKSGPSVSGKVVGGSEVPAHINVAPRAPSPEPPSMSMSNNSNRQSVDWYAGLAADSTPIVVDRMPSMSEEVEEPYEPHFSQPQPPPSVPDIHVEDHESTPQSESDLMADVDRTVELKVRTLYAYEGDGAEDITFGENDILIANPSKTGGDWWFGRSLRDGRSGMFPKTYVAEIQPTTAKAIYAYNASNTDELSFAEGETLDIIDASEEEWWKVERAGTVYIVPAAYLSMEEGSIRANEASLDDNRPTLESTSYSTSPQTTIAKLDLEVPDDDTSTDNDEDDDYFSLSEDDSENEADSDAREHERQRVLEAAGLIVKKEKDVQPPPRPVRRRSKDKAPGRRPPPAAPLADRSSVVSSSSSGKDLPALPELALDDAYDRYESFRGHHQRLSVASIETNPAVPPSPSSPSVMTTSTSTGSEGVGRGYSQLLNFLGRKTPNSGEGVSVADRKATISGPILQTPENGYGSRSNSPAFGSSWASLVDKSALEGIPTMERKRQEAIFELIVTEETYVKDLQLIVETFYSSMMPLLERKAITVVFANIEDILLTNTTFMSELEQRQKECRLYVDRIGDILQSHMSNMAVYMEYCVNQGNAIKVLKSLRDSNPELASHLQRLKEDPLVRNLDLSSYLLAPMQRITRYPLLIKQILSYTELGTEHKAVHKSITTAEKILEHINESIREQEGRETLKRISQNLWIGQGRLDLTAPTRHMGARRLLKEGPDILVLTDAGMKTLYRMPIPLNEAQVKDAPGNRDDTIFQVALPYPRGGDAVVLRASSVRDCQLWTDAIEAASRKCREAEKLGTRKVPSTSSYSP